MIIENGTFIWINIIIYAGKRSSRAHIDYYQTNKGKTQSVRT